MVTGVGSFELRSLCPDRGEAVRAALEERLPASPFWRAEWWALGEGTDRSRYWPLSHIEQWIPVLFALAYVSGFFAAILA